MCLQAPEHLSPKDGPDQEATEEYSNRLWKARARRGGRVSFCYVADQSCAILNRRSAEEVVAPALPAARIPGIAFFAQRFACEPSCLLRSTQDGLPEEMPR